MAMNKNESLKNNKNGGRKVKNIFKKNSVIITALAIMIAIAGYLNYSGNKLGKEDAEATNSTNVAQNELSDISDEDILSQASTDGTQPAEQASSGDIESLDVDLNNGAAVSSDEVASTGGETPGEAVLANSSNVGFAAQAKLDKEQLRAKNKETLMEVINNTNITEEQKQTAIDNMIAMTAIAEKETSAEMLLEAKGFTDVVVSVTENGADVIVNAAEVSDAQRAQIEDIVKRKTDVPAENIVITTMNATE